MSKKKTGKYASQKKKSRKGLVAVLVIVLLLLLALAAVMLLGLPVDENVTGETEFYEAAETEVEDAPAMEQPQEIASAVENAVNLGYGLFVTDIGSYTGIYMEDGSDQVISGVLMLVLKNNGDQDVQYAEINMTIGEQTAVFTVTTLPVGESVILLETSRMQWNRDVDYNAILPKIENIAYFQEPISTQEDKLKISIVDGAINVTNISGEDIPGNIVVYYKNAAKDLYYGGITYRITVEGGLKAGEIRQVMTKHSSDTGSRIMFATIAQ